VRAFWTGVAILGALLVQTALTQLLPLHARVFDPFLVLMVYCGLTGGETHGMLAGAAAGWIQDIHFGGRVLGLSGLSKVLVGFGVGIAATRFHLVEPAPRGLVLLAAALLDSVIFSGLASAFDVAAAPLTGPELALRGGVNAVLGVLLFAVYERQLRRWKRR
jgi:rod shape-determining protein MreD